jgi:hypothetical protein
VLQWVNLSGEPPLNKSRFETTKELLANGTVIPRPPKLCMIGDRPGLADCIMISLCFCTHFKPSELNDLDACKKRLITG